MYLGKTSIVKKSKITSEEKMSNIRTRVYNRKTIGQYEMSNTIGASKSFTSKSHYLHCKSLHSLPKFASKTQRIQVGNGKYVSILFIIPIIVDIHGHRFKVYALVSEIHKNVDLVLGIKNVFELEGAML